MNLLTLFFIYSLALTITLPALFHHLHLIFFAPFLIITIYKKNKITCLWLALLCGLIIDLLSAQMRLGIYALNYCLTLYLLYPYKKHFFEDSVSTLPIMTYLFSVISTCIQLGLLSLFEHLLPLSLEWFVDNLFFIPLKDACYAAVGFSFPYLCFPMLFKRKSASFSKKNKYYAKTR